MPDITQTNPDAVHGLLPASTVLCVDLDGTLVKSDTLVDSVLALARHRPVDLLKLPGWIAQGKPRFKQHLTAAVTLDVEHLPYNQPLLEFLRTEHARGRVIWLATAADVHLAERVAELLGLFAGVIATDAAASTRNIAGGGKLAALWERFGQDFSYIGNAKPDVALLKHCVAPMVANPDGALLAGLKKARVTPVARFEDRRSGAKSWLKAVRLHQWAKNTLIFLPLLLAHSWNHDTLTAAALAFVSFGLCASATYMVNDLLDIESDRRHRSKRRRPFAAGDLSPIAGAGAIVVMLTVSLLLALAVQRVPGAVPGVHGFVAWLGLYTVTTLTYSLYLKRKLLLDVFVLSGLYTLRMMAGSAATGVPVSTWLAGFSVFLFLSLAFVKRFSELEHLREQGTAVSNGRGYLVSDLEQLRALGTGAAYASVVVLTLYIWNGTGTLYHHAGRLWLAVIVLLMWLSQVWMLAGRGEMHDDPVVFAVTDKRSLLLGVLMALTVLWAL